MLLIAGLGNPGREYETTRHNIGFMVVSGLCEKYKLRPVFESKFNAIVAKGNILGLDTILVKPLTFMNLSGSSILKLLNWYKINIEDILVVYDDIDFNLGEIRFKKGGSAGGHNGISSIMNISGGKKSFNRLRVGIGPGPEGAIRKNFVLTPFLTEQQPLVFDTINLSVEGIELFIQNGLETAKNKFNSSKAGKITEPKQKQNKKTFEDSCWVKVNRKTLNIDKMALKNIKNEIYPIDLLSFRKGV